MRISWTLAGLTALLLALTVAFLFEVWGRTATLSPIPLVDPEFTNTATVRVSFADLKKSDGDASAFDCYACHERNKPVQLHFDTNFNVVLPDMHKDLVMGHGQHRRNNNCFNCHDESNLENLQTRDGKVLKLWDSAPLCGSCHGPTYRDWEAGVHGRTSGYWDRQVGAMDRKICVNCHNPHSPPFPSRAPAPGPHPLRAPAMTTKTHSEKK